MSPKKHKIEFTYGVFGDRVPTDVGNNTNLPKKAEWSVSNQELTNQLDEALCTLAAEYDNQPAKEQMDYQEVMDEIAKTDLRTLRKTTCMFMKIRRMVP